jgi:hypothetical protein
MGKILRLSGVNLTDASAPQIIERDAIESAGSLFLFDGAHDYGAFTGVPEVGGTIPNALWNKAAELLGAGDAGTLAFTVPSKSADSATWKTERTLRGGLHGIVTQAGSQVGELTMRITPSDALRDYILAEMASHQFYFSLWSGITRVGIANNADQSPFHFAQNTSNFLFHFQSGRSNGPSATPPRAGIRNEPNALGDHITGPSVPYSRFGAIGVNGISGTGPVSGSSFGLRLGTADSWTSFNFNKTPSRIIYRAYAEDLTVSGRTYAEVEAIDYAMYQAAFAVDGKFYGDTFTNPATIP